MLKTLTSKHGIWSCCLLLNVWIQLNYFKGWMPPPPKSCSTECPGRIGNCYIRIRPFNYTEVQNVITRGYHHESRTWAEEPWVSPPARCTQQNLPSALWHNTPEKKKEEEEWVMTTSTASQDSLESHFLLTSIWQAVAFSSRPAVLIPKLCWSPRLTNSQPSSSDMFSMSWALKEEKWKSFKWILYITHTRITYISPSRQHITAILNMNTWQWADILQRDLWLLIYRHWFVAIWVKVHGCSFYSPLDWSGLKRALVTAHLNACRLSFQTFRTNWTHIRSQCRWHRRQLSVTYCQAGPPQAWWRQSSSGGPSPPADTAGTPSPESCTFSPRLRSCRRSKPRTNHSSWLCVTTTLN